MKTRIILFLACIAFVVTISSFGSANRFDMDGNDTTLFKRPQNFPPPVYNFKDNRLTKPGFELGRRLFYDATLSKDGSISCANCHQQFAAFAQLDHPVSHGVDDCLGTRNTPALFNLAWQREFMWDGGVNHLEVSPLNALTNPCEMANDLNEIVARLKGSDSYPALFRQVFPSAEINSQTVLKALAQFMAALISSNSKYDKVMRGEPGASFSEQETAGFALFKANCESCHKGPLFTDLNYRSNGLDQVSDDIGRDSITHSAADRGKFRVPSLRNIEVSGPYMHDGRFDKLDQVLEHYNSGVKNATNLDALLKVNASAPGIRLTKAEQQQVIAFLKTLTDHQFLSDKRFQEPAKN